MSLADVVAAAMFAGVVVYALFGGADFGSGFWDLTAGGARRGGRLRVLIDHSIGPVWEANHVWLIYVLVFWWTAFPRAFAAAMTTLFVPLRAGAARDRPARRRLRLPQVRRDAGPGAAVRRGLRRLVADHTVLPRERPPERSPRAGCPSAGYGDLLDLLAQPDLAVRRVIAVAHLRFLAGVFLTADAQRSARPRPGRAAARRAPRPSGWSPAPSCWSRCVPIRHDAPTLSDGLTGRALPLVVAVRGRRRGDARAAAAPPLRPGPARRRRRGRRRRRRAGAWRSTRGCSPTSSGSRPPPDRGPRWSGCWSSSALAVVLVVPAARLPVLADPDREPGATSPPGRVSSRDERTANGVSPARNSTTAQPAITGSSPTPAPAARPARCPSGIPRNDVSVSHEATRASIAVRHVVLDRRLPRDIEEDQAGVADHCPDDHGRQDARARRKPSTHRPSAAGRASRPAYPRGRHQPRDRPAPTKPPSPSAADDGADRAGPAEVADRDDRHQDEDHPVGHVIDRGGQDAGEQPVAAPDLAPALGRSRATSAGALARLTRARIRARSRPRRGSSRRSPRTRSGHRAGPPPGRRRPGPTTWQPVRTRLNVALACAASLRAASPSASARSSPG